MVSLDRLATLFHPKRYLLPNRRVLLVDDISDHRQEIRHQLERSAGVYYEVLEASDKQSALDFIRRYDQQIDAIVVDINLDNAHPRRTNTEGIDVALEAQDIPTIIVTEHAQDAQAIGRIMQRKELWGTTTFVAKKPGYEDKVIQSINRLLRVPNTFMSQPGTPPPRRRGVLEIQEGPALVIQGIIIAVSTIAGVLLGIAFQQPQSAPEVIIQLPAVATPAVNTAEEIAVDLTTEPASVVVEQSAEQTPADDGDA